MAKQTLSLKTECYAVNKRKSNGNVLFVMDVETDDKSKIVTAKTTINLQTQDVTMLAGLDPEKKYLITITEQ